MDESFLGVTCVLLLFIICLLLGFFAVLIKYKHFDKPKSYQKAPEIFYVTASKKPKRKAKKSAAISVKAALVNKNDLKKLLGK